MQQWQDLAKAYTEETGVPVTVVTAASGNYETTLMSEMGKSGAPTLFQVNGPVGLANWKDYCYDLSGSDIYGQLTSDNYALKEGDTVYGIAYVIESIRLDYICNTIYGVSLFQCVVVTGKLSVNITARQVIAVILPVRQTNRSIYLEQSRCSALTHLTHQSCLIITRCCCYNSYPVHRSPLCKLLPDPATADPAPA